MERQSTSRKVKVLTASCNNNDTSRTAGVAGTPQRKVLKSMQSTQFTAPSFPTVLELDHIKRGAVKSRFTPTSVDTLAQSGEGDGSCDSDTCVRQKLHDARCLEAARELGLGKAVAKLRSFSEFGGTQKFSEELVRSLSTACKSHDERCSTLSQKLVPFCQTFDVNFDECLLQYLEGLCSSTTATELTIQEAASGPFLGL